MKISILQKNSNTAYAARELKLFLSEFTSAEIGCDGGERRIVLEADPLMPEHHYSIHGDGSELIIKGGNASSVLCGVCEALSDAGIFFQATGYSVPTKFDVDVLFSVNKDVEPKFRQRGIRQYINFPMDISSYTLKEAKEYIRSIARMRYNAITFHSYAGQWHEGNPDDPADFAGHFFYGQVHPIPQNEPLITERVKNRKYYCIPEVEAIFEDKAAKSEYAKYWLNEVMSTAKEAGMKIAMSVEIRNDDMELNARMLHNVCETYPLIDMLELITEECGGYRGMPELTLEKLTGFMTENFGDDILDENGRFEGFPESLPHQLGSSAISLRRLLDAMEIRDKWLAGLDHVPELRGSLYLTCTDTLKILRPIIRKKLPEGMTLGLLPAHGALATADNIEQTGTLSSDWQNTMFYSWAEFDGNMYIQQLSTDGIEKLTSLPDTDSSYGFSINHWRTSENNLTINYAAEAGINALSADEYYRAYAEKLDIRDVDAFAETCSKLAALDTYNRDNLFNIGFCFIGCWFALHRNGDAILPRLYPADAQLRSVEEYNVIIAQLEKLLPSAHSKDGIAFIRLMLNRCRTSVMYIRSHMTLDKIAELYDFDNLPPVTAEQKEKILAVIAEARDLAVEYLRVYGELLPDRGCEGQIISYYETMLVFIDTVRAYFDRSKAGVQEDVYDEPPMPDAEAK